MSARGPSVTFVGDSVADGAKAVGERLRLLRGERGLRQKDIAARLGVDRSTVTAYETGKRELDGDTLQRFADIYGVSVDYLLGRTNYRNPGPLPESLDPTLRPILSNPAFLEAVKHPAVRELLASPEVQIYLRAAASLEEMDAQSLIAIAEAVKDAKARLADKNRERPD